MKKERGISGFSRNKKGQVTIFIIIAILIVGIVALIYFLIPRAETTTGFDTQNPQGFIQNCMDDRIEEVVSTLSAQGGSVAPEFYFNYQGNSIEYLCYTNEFYRPCVIQQPVLQQHIIDKITGNIASDVETCFANLEANYEAEGYSVNIQSGKTVVELLPKRFIVNFTDYILTTTKADTARHDSFSVVLNNNLYELTSIANSIINWEEEYGDAETTAYMIYYKDLKVEKHLQQDGTKIYIITDRNTGDNFQFATRSGAWPPGFG